MKKLLCWVCLAAMVFALAACGSGQEIPYHASGMDGELLYVNYEGETHTYQRHQGGQGSLTPSFMLDMFETNTEIEGIIWMAYATEEYPELEYVLLISGTNVVWTYRALE